MSKVALRVYNREIETLVDQGHIEEAIAHCQHILKLYPKHLETYRLLGKAYLEAHRHTDAADIFQRILVAVPDDFISQLGMSLVRDEQKDMDGAIWHMERAFEVNPSNAAVQGELRRLYGRRDGLEPPKIRLTRGALAHMYTKGGQYQQAVAEIKSVLAEDATRNDMKVLMARAFYRAGQKVEATEICIDLLKQFPYCLDANRILVEVLPGTSLSQSLDTYKKRVQALDPYAAMVTASIFEIDDVPDNAVTIDRLEWDPGSVSPQDSFASSSGQSGEPIPDFLRTSGWGPSTGEFQEGPVDFDDEPAAPAAASGLAAAEIPDWLKAMAPPGSSAQSAAPTAQADAANLEPEDLDWLSGLGGPVAGSLSLDTQTESAAPASSQDQPDWMKDLGGSATVDQPPAGSGVSDAQPDWMKDLGAAPATAEAAPATADDSLDWLQTLGGSQNASVSQADTPAAQPDAAPTDDMDWLKGLGAPADAPPAATPIQVSEVAASQTGAASADDTDWLKNLGEPAATPASDVSASQPDAVPADDMDWLKGLGAPTEEAPAAAATPASDVSASQPEAAPADDMDWLKGLGAPTEEAPAAAATPVSDVSTSQPGAAAADDADWLKNLGGPAATPVSDLSASQPEAAPADDMDWLKGLGAPTDEAPAATPIQVSDVAAASQPGAAPADDMDWLKNLGEPAAGAPVSDAPTSQTGAAPADDADWLKNLGQPVSEDLSEPVMPGETVAVAPPSQFEPEAKVPKDLSGDDDNIPPLSAPVSGPGTSDMDQDDAMKWLESLAQKQGAKAEELITNPNERTETAPGWVAKVDEAPTASAQAEAPPVAATPGVSTPEQDDSMQWLEGLAANQAQPEELSAKPAETTPGWVETGIPAYIDQPTIPQKRFFAQDDPNFVPGPLSAPVSGPGTSASEQDDAMKWLESLAEKQGAKAEELITNPGERTDEAPTWTTQPVAAQPVIPPVETPPPPTAAQPTIVQKPMAQDDPNFVPGPLSAPVSGPGTSASEQDDAMKWLESLAEKQGAKAEELITNPGERTDEAPTWATQPVAAQPPVETPPPPPPTAAQPTIVQKPMAQDDPNFVPGPLSAPVSGPGTSASEQDDAMKWLESLAEKQGAKAEELITNPGERTDEAPTWATQPVAAQPPVETPPAAVEAAPAMQDDDTLNWLQGLATSETVSEPVAEEPAAQPTVGSMPWEQEETPAQPAIEESAPPVAEAAPSNDVSEWLKNLDVQDQRQPAAAAEEVPDWLNQTPSGPAAEDDLPDWLKDQSADEQPPAPTPAAAWVPDSPVAESPAVTATPPAAESEPKLIFSPPLESPPPVPPEILSFDAPPAAPEPVPASTRVPTTPIQPPTSVRPAVRQTGMLGDKDGPALQNARHLIAHGNLDAAMNGYIKLIKRGKFLEEVIYDLKEATYSHPVDVIIWQTLGDAHMRANQLQEALDAYTKAEELLR